MKKIAIIGVGGVARYAHLPSYKSNDIEVVALCDINKNLLEEVGKEFQIKKLYIFSVFKSAITTIISTASCCLII